MEAAWAGDIERIKALTLQAWGPMQQQPPLKMAVTHQWRDSPFSLAFLRGHYEVARAILEIVKAQWSPPDKESLRYRMETQDEDDDEYDSEAESDDSDTSEPRIVSEKVDQEFTIDNIGQISMQVKSHVKPLTVICDVYPTIKTSENSKITSSSQLSLFTHAMDEDNVAGLKFLLDLAQHYATQKFDGDDDEDEDESGGNFTFPEAAYNWAIEHGKIDQLGLIIKRTGAGLPLDHLVKKSGVVVKKKPRYYQGLTVYGKKRYAPQALSLALQIANYESRNDWATAGRNMVVKTTTSRTPPLLYAVLQGRIESVEFYLGDGPHRLYSEFSKSKAGREDSRLKRLRESFGGFDRTVAKWLGTNSKSLIILELSIANRITQMTWSFTAPL